MKILNFDTSLDKTYITLSDNGNILVSEIIENQEGKYHSAFLIPELVKILGDFNLNIKDLDYIATNLGPGSFTGIRAGLTVARTLCQQAGVKAIGFTSLEILSKINTSQKNTLVMLDARKDMAYVEILSPAGQIIEKPCAKLVEDVINLIKKEDYFVICDEKMAQTLDNRAVEYVNYKAGDYDLGKYLNELAVAFAKTNPDYDYNWAKLKPLYIQPPPVTISKVKI